MHVILLCSTDLRKGQEQNQIALYIPPAG